VVFDTLDLRNLPGEQDDGKEKLSRRFQTGRSHPDRYTAGAMLTQLAAELGVSRGNVVGLVQSGCGADPAPQHHPRRWPAAGMESPKGPRRLRAENIALCADATRCPLSVDVL
jgi:hypothetical protein